MIKLPETTQIASAELSPLPQKTPIHPTTEITRQPTDASQPTEPVVTSKSTGLLPTLPYSGEIQPTPDQVDTVVATIGGASVSGEIAFASMRDGYPQIWLMNADGSNQRQLTNLKDGACQPDWSPNGMQVVFVSPCQNRDTRYKKSNMFIINHDGTNLTILDAGVGGNYDPNWSPDGVKIAFTKELSSFTQIYMMDLVSGVVTALADSRSPNAATRLVSGR